MNAKTVDSCLEDASHTGVLNISGRNLRTYPVTDDSEGPFSHKELLEIDMSKNRFQELPRLIYAGEALVSLNCYQNTIRAIPEGIRKLGNLLHLNMRRNYLTTIPLELCTMVQLRSLIISHNRLESLPPEIGNLVSLQHLDVSSNFVREIPGTVSSLVSLKVLNFHNNHVERIPDGITKLPLTDLIMSDNLLSYLPTAIKSMKFLVTLEVDNNPLKSPPMQVCCRGRVHIFKFLSRVEQRGNEPSRDEKSFAKGKNRRTNTQSYLRSRPISSISTISEGTVSSEAQKSVLLEDFESMVNSAFNGYKDTATILKMGPNGTLPSPDKHRKPISGKTAYPSSPASTRRAELLGTLPRSKVTKSPKESQSQSTLAPLNVNSYEDSPQLSTGNKMLSAYANKKDPQTMKTYRSVPPSASPDISQSHGDSVHQMKSRTRSNAFSKEEVARVHQAVPPNNYVEDSLAPMRKDDAYIPGTRKHGTGTGAEVPISPSTIPKITSSAVDRDETPEVEVMTPVSRTQPDIAEVDSVEALASLDSMLEKEENMWQNSPSPKPQRKPLALQPLSNPSFSSPKSSPLTRKKKSATIADTKDVEISLNMSPAAHRKSLPPTSAEAEWVDRLVLDRNQNVPVLQQLKTHKKPQDYTIRRHKKNIQEELELEKNIREAIEMLVPGCELTENLAECFSDGVLLCQLVNRLFPRCALSIMDGEPMTVIKKSKNVDSFVGACKKLGVMPLCAPGDLLDCKNSSQVYSCIKNLLHIGHHSHSTV